jgi:uncharacterized protein YoxC
MAGSSGTPTTRRIRVKRRGTIACAVAIAAIAAAGCGSSKPAYCSARTDLENSVKGLTSLNVSSGVSGLEAQVKKIETSATKLVSQAKSDFPSETQAIKSSVNSLVAAVKGLPSSPSAGQIAAVTADASKVVSSVKSFTDATSSKCK